VKSAHPRIALFCRFPDPGRTKTRLIPAIGADGAARVHERLARRTCEVLKAGNPGYPVEVQFTGATAKAFRDWLGEGAEYAEQVAGGLTERLLAACEPTPVIFFGADTPDLTVAHVHAAVAALKNHEVVVGPAQDGGYYLIGISRPMPFLFTEMPWSTEQVLPQTLARLARHHIEPVLLDTLADCDRPEDLPRWSWLTA
jgi:uncharacterized protein